MVYFQFQKYEQKSVTNQTKIPGFTPKNEGQKGQKKTTNPRKINLETFSDLFSVLLLGSF